MAYESAGYNYTRNARILGPAYFLMGQAYENKKVDDITLAIESYENGAAINRGPGVIFGTADDMHRQAEKLRILQAQRKK